jgi:hypothetical protein
LGAVAACKTTQVDSESRAKSFSDQEKVTLLDVHDVSVLFPRDQQTGEPVPSLPLTDFVAPEVFDQVLRNATSDDA